MPRLLPRLLQQLSITTRPLDQWLTSPMHGSTNRNRRPRPRQHRPLPPPVHLPGRTQSFLLDEGSAVSNHNLYALHKTPPPRLSLTYLRASSAVPHPHTGNASSTNMTTRSLRDMSLEERRWWCNPYLRILSSRMRKCALTHKYIPRDLLIRLVPFQFGEDGLSVSGNVNSSRSVLLPNGIERPDSGGEVVGKGSYVLCDRVVLEEYLARGTWKRLAKGLHSSPTLPDHIEHILRVRILQELDSLGKRLERNNQNALTAPLMQRLTRAQWFDVKAEGMISLSNAVAVIVAPPVNKDKQTKIRPLPKISSERPTDDISIPISSRETLPSCRMLLSQPMHSNHVPPARIPLYNGATLFPSRSQRSALYSGLSRVLSVERRARWRQRETPSNSSDGAASVQSRDDHQKASHAYVVFSNEGTLSRADTVPLAIALWRLRMWQKRSEADAPSVA